MTRSDPIRGRTPGTGSRWRRRSSRAVTLLVRCCLLLFLCYLLTGGVGLASAHVGHDGSTPTEPLEPAESPPWTAAVVGGVGVLVVLTAIRAVRDGRVSGRLGGAAVAAGVLLVVGGVAAFAWL